MRRGLSALGLVFGLLFFLSCDVFLLEKGDLGQPCLGDSTTDLICKPGLFCDRSSSSTICVLGEECLPGTCSGHGDCDDSSGRPVCSCHEGYEGDFCDSCDATHEDCDSNGSCECDTSGTSICYLADCCTPDCTGKECGSDGCGGICEPGCDVDEACHETTWRCVNVGVFVTLEAGTFEMGSPEGEAGRQTDEAQYTVTLSRGFRMLSTEVTQGRFEALMEYNPSDHTGCGTDCPVENVNWYEAAAYCNALSATVESEECYTCTGEHVDVICEPNAVYATPYDCPGYRLPTEAEWEYAARAGTVTATYNGDLDSEYLDCGQPNDVLDPIAWFCGNSGDTTHTVGTREPNDWDLYDMLGNVWEWCHDGHEDYPTGSVIDPWGATPGSDRVLRGGSWGYGAWHARAARRYHFSPVYRSYGSGFRPVRSSP
ncbi:MAG: formylglycine-generating enzyme family protein [Deltaproteobacteria bacterium]|nr:formylglycine-generating enzyme family protein [Deltaproteobacteria bacterium]